MHYITSPCQVLDHNTPRHHEEYHGISANIRVYSPGFRQARELLNPLPKYWYFRATTHTWSSRGELLKCLAYGELSLQMSSMKVSTYCTVLHTLRSVPTFSRNAAAPQLTLPLVFPEHQPSLPILSLFQQRSYLGSPCTGKRSTVTVRQYNSSRACGRHASRRPRAHWQLTGGSFRP